MYLSVKIIPNWVFSCMKNIKYRTLTGLDATAYPTTSNPTTSVPTTFTPTTSIPTTSNPTTSPVTTNTFYIDPLSNNTQSEYVQVELMNDTRGINGQNNNNWKINQGSAQSGNFLFDWYDFTCLYILHLLTQ